MLLFNIILDLLAPCLNSCFFQLREKRIDSLAKFLKGRYSSNDGLWSVHDISQDISPVIRHLIMMVRVIACFNENCWI